MNRLSRRFRIVSTILLLHGFLVVSVAFGLARHPSASTAMQPQVLAGLNDQPQATHPPECDQEQPGITPEEAAQVIPLAPVSVSVAAREGEVIVTWPGTGEDIAAYEILRRSPAAEDWQLLGRVESVDDNRGTYVFRDVTAPSGVTIVYGVIAVGRYGKGSAAAESEAVTPG